MKTFGRFFVRSDGKLLLGAVDLRGIEALKPGHVYALVDVMGDIMIKEVGPSCVSQSDSLEKVGITDGSDANGLISRGGKHLWTVKDAEEFAQMAAAKKKD